MEAFFTLWVPEQTPLLTIVARLERSSSTSIRLGFGTERSVITEFIWTVLPAHRSDSFEILFTLGVAKSATLIFVSGTVGDNLANTSSFCLEPA